MTYFEAGDRLVFTDWDEQTVTYIHKEETVTSLHEAQAVTSKQALNDAVYKAVMARKANHPEWTQDEVMEFFREVGIVVPVAAALKALPVGSVITNAVGGVALKARSQAWAIASDDHLSHADSPNMRAFTGEKGFNVVYRPAP